MAEREGETTDSTARSSTLRKKRMLKSLLLLVALVSGSRCFPASDNSPKEHRSNWPCPVDTAIAPCVCTIDEDENMFLDCSEVSDEQTLAKIFTQDSSFPFLKFTYLTISPSLPSRELDALPAGVFGAVRFENVLINGTFIETIEAETFRNSRETLMTLDLSNNLISVFPFETIPSFVYLRALSLANNNLADMVGELPDIVSDSLRIFTLAGNSGLSLTPSTFSQMKIVEELHLQNMRLESIPPNVFSRLDHIHTIDLSYNDFFGELIQNFTNPPSHRLRMIHLDNNKLFSIHPMAITGLNSIAQVDLRNNRITELGKENWSSLLDDVIRDNAIDLRDNPRLKCGCDVYWLVADRQQMVKVHEDTVCHSGERLHDLPLSYFEDHCPSGPALW
ncbi:oplophorus-luciferin 2-monooxygenase non-catalytic subunit-like [Panulirus ornatus]|uniref:oplophorus-luciferin 2-monooxygenase non-catalytic subunit-like n=1 Tax=Panulirus ornatus TaxID=150431 RepID=UPI003A880039